jgi:hypothetical protein
MRAAEQRIAEGILCADQYQLTMAQLYYRMGIHEQSVQFDLFSSGDADRKRFEDTLAYLSDHIEVRARAANHVADVWRAIKPIPPDIPALAGAARQEGRCEEAVLYRRLRFCPSRRAIIRSGGW